jgi:hypothetical protein
MVKHIVLWTFKDGVDKDVTFTSLKELFASFVFSVPGLRNFQLHRGYQGYDVCLESEHDDASALEAYQHFPAHLEAKEVVKATRNLRASCDFEII